jgi:inhibitor of cysteine peptidase
MLSRILCLGCVFGFLLTTVGCSSGQLKLSSSDNGRMVSVKVGVQIMVELKGNPSTGYTWETENLDSTMIQQVGETAFRSSNSGLVGAGGSLGLTFKTLKAGTTTLNLVYHRPWEKDVKPQETFTVTLTIK